MDAHGLICALKDLAIHLGRVPKRDEFVSGIRNGRELVSQKFGTYAALIQAAGLYGPKSMTVDNSIFDKNIAEVIQEHEPLESVEQPTYTPTLVVGDTHFPFVHQKTLEAIYEFARIHKPKRIIQMGDLYDMYAHSKFPRSLNQYSPKQEEELGRSMAEKMWATLREICPDAECIQIKGNHDVRPVKRTLEVQPSVEHIIEKHLNYLMSFEGVNLITDPRQEYIVEGIEFLHGYRSKIGAHRDYALMNAVCGHLHRGGTSYRRFRGQTFWELNAGFVGDPESKALGYTPQKIADYTLGFGWIDQFGPRFIPL